MPDLPMTSLPYFWGDTAQYIYGNYSTHLENYIHSEDTGYIDIMTSLNLH